MGTNEKRPRLLAESKGAKNDASNESLLPVLTPVVNTNGRRLWSAFRRYARNHRRIARLIADNEILLDRIKQIQGVAS